MAFHQPCPDPGGMRSPASRWG